MRYSSAVSILLLTLAIAAGAYLLLNDDRGVGESKPELNVPAGEVDTQTRPTQIDPQGDRSEIVASVPTASADLHWWEDANLLEQYYESFEKHISHSEVAMGSEYGPGSQATIESLESRGRQVLERRIAGVGIDAEVWYEQLSELRLPGVNFALSELSLQSDVEASRNPPDLRDPERAAEFERTPFSFSPERAAAALAPGDTLSPEDLREAALYEIQWNCLLQEAAIADHVAAVEIAHLNAMQAIGVSERPPYSADWLPDQLMYFRQQRKQIHDYYRSQLMGYVSSRN